jgi:hypothetical protein
MRFFEKFPRSLLRLVTAVCTGLLFCSAPDSLARGDAEARTWTSRAGSQFVGVLSEERADAVVLVNAAGQEVVVALEQLSADDRAFLRDRQRKRHERLLAFYRAGHFDREDLPEKAEIKGIRHVVQRENFCVPASAEMVLKYHGFSYDQDYLARITSQDSARSAGTNFGDLMRAMRNVGVDSVAMLRGPSADPAQIENAMSGIRSAIAEGFPVLISYENRQSGHSVVAISYDDRRRAFWVMDPAANSSSQRLDYKVLERLLTGAVVLIPAPRPVAEMESAGRDAFLSTLSAQVRLADPGALQGLVGQLREQGISARLRDANRADLNSSQGQTRSFARQQGVDFVRLALERGMVVVAPQTFEDGPGLILLYGLDGNQFRAVEYLADGTFRRGEVRPLDFSLRWMWREENRFLLPLVEIELTAASR